jgi:Fe-S-cluster containining protein
MNDHRSQPHFTSLADAVASCAADADFLSELGKILRQGDHAAEDRHWACRACGKCCRFEQFGHKLYVTAGELAYLIRQPETEADPQNGASRLQTTPPAMCPYQDGDRCLARDGRALGCRLFFCDPAAAGWCNNVYEELHDKIKRLHAAHGLPYIYTELTSALTELARSGS